MKLVNMRDSKSRVARLEGSSPSSGTIMSLKIIPSEPAAYIIGIAVGDGSLLNPNGRATRLRITCDSKYPIILEEIEDNLKYLFPKNKVSKIHRKDNCVDISIYSNKLQDLLPWTHTKGPKTSQKIRSPEWVKNKDSYICKYLKGLFQSDGSIYLDREYTMVNLTSHNKSIIYDARSLVEKLGFQPYIYKNKKKYTLRISKDVGCFIKKTDLYKKKINKPKLITVLGPTATGKSDLGVLLAKEFNGEIISADSRQVYKGLDIGSGKITKTEMKGVPHHLLDVVKPQTTFTVQQFRKKTDKAIKDIIKRGKVPILVGGTGFYIDAVTQGLDFPQVPPNKELRKKLETQSTEKLFKQLSKKDPIRAQSIDPDNKVRLVRALEIIAAVGKVPQAKQDSPYENLFIGLQWTDKITKERIKLRLDKRMKIGMVAEVRKLHKQGLSWKRMEALGLEYRYLARFLQNKISKEEMLTEIETKSWQFARRQKTWFGRNKEVQWFTPKEYKKIEKITRNFLE